MPMLKKLIVIPFFIVIFALLIYKLTPLLKSYDFVFSLSINTLIDLIIISALVCLSSLLFVLFVCFSQDLKFILPVSIFAALIPMLFLDPAEALIIGVAIFISFLLTGLNLNGVLKNYLTFEPRALLNPAVRHLSGLLILAFCLIYFLQISKIISQRGFQIPDSLVEATLKFSSPSNLANNLLKQAVKDQIQIFIKPYLNIIPAILAVLLFLTFQSLTSILNLLISPLLSAIFLILEKVGFVKFETEQRPVKKMII